MTVADSVPVFGSVTYLHAASEAATARHTPFEGRVIEELQRASLRGRRFSQPDPPQFARSRTRQVLRILAWIGLLALSASAAWAIEGAVISRSSDAVTSVEVTDQLLPLMECNRPDVAHSAMCDHPPAKPACYPLEAGVDARCD